MGCVLFLQENINDQENVYAECTSESDVLLTSYVMTCAYHKRKLRRFDMKDTYTYPKTYYDATYQ